MRNLFLSFLACSAAFEPKLCITCKHFMKAGHNRYAKCKKFPIIVDRIEDLISGYSKHQYTDYNYCSTARKFGFMCSENGKHHEPFDFTEEKMDKY